MYIGSTGARGLRHLVYEVVDNAFDEALAGHNDRVSVTIHPDDSITVVDNGRGIPVDMMEEQGLSALTVVLTNSPRRKGGISAARATRSRVDSTASASSVVNALSEWLVADVRRDGKVHRQEFARGVSRTADVETVGEVDADDTGTTISYLADAEVFDETVYDATTLLSRFPRDGVPDARVARFLHRRARRRGAACRVPLRGWDPRLRRPRELEAKDPVHPHVVCVRGRDRAGRPGRGRVCSGTPRTSSPSTRSRTTSTRPRAATHPLGLPARRSPARSTSYARDKGLLKEKEDNLEGEDVREGLAAVISVKLLQPQFEGQTKTKLGNSEVEAGS